MGLFRLAFIVFYARLPKLVGVVAQLVERLVRNEEVRGSTPLGSTILKAHYIEFFLWFVSVLRQWRDTTLLGHLKMKHFNKISCLLAFCLFLAGCATYIPAPNSPRIIIHAEENAVKNYLVNDLVNKGWTPETDSQFTITLDKAGGFWQNVFFGSQWNPQTMTRMTLNFVDTGNGINIIYHATILTNPGSGFQQQTEISGDWPHVQYWLDCMAADLEKRPRPAQPVFPAAQPVTMRPKTS